METGETRCSFCAYPIGKSFTQLECSHLFHPKCIHSKFAAAYSVCPVCKVKIDMNKLFDFGDDVDVEKAIRSWNPHQTMVTYPSGEVKRSLWTEPNETDSWLKKAWGPSDHPAIDDLLVRFDAPTLIEKFGVDGEEISNSGLTFEDLISIKGGDRLTTLKFLCDLKATSRDLHRLGFFAKSEDEANLLKREIFLLDDEERWCDQHRRSGKH